MDVAVTGSHGLIGGALVRSLEGDGHQVRRLVRADPGPGEVRWDPRTCTIDSGGLDGVDAVVHLAGAGIATGRWTEQHKRQVRDSRTKGTALLAEALAGLERPPRVLVSGSAVGWYGDRGDEVLSETSPTGDGFLAEVCQAWEAAAGMAEQAGIRVCRIRTGIVLSREGGALAAQLLPYKLGLGGPAGDGHQWMSWITLADEVAAIRFLLEADGVSGPVNLTAPEPVRNRDFAKALGRALHRPAVLPIPKLAGRLPAGIGPLVENLLFVSQRVEPVVLQGAGYHFTHASLDAALAAALAR
ncbi:MAG: TIGR01777 family protein [Actinobacteria bacterium]|nr:TIGR01777 family protein [Actinomycetota bacterium]